MIKTMIWINILKFNFVNLYLICNIKKMSSSRYYINDSIVHYVTFEAINYIINKDIEQKQMLIVRKIN